MKIKSYLAMTALAATGLCVSTGGLANSKPVLNQITYQVSASKWASTNTAKVIVAINASLDSTAMGNLHQEIMANLKKIADSAQWNITQFNRSVSQSGLEQVSVLAQARIADTKLSQLRNQAKAVSKPGQKYSIAAIQFSPSQAEIENVKNSLRDEIYSDVKSQVAQLNKTFSGQNYTVHQIAFSVTTPEPIARPTVFMNAMVRAKQQGSQSMAVSNKVTVTANVVLAEQMKK